MYFAFLKSDSSAYVRLNLIFSFDGYQKPPITDSCALQPSRVLYRPAKWTIDCGVPGGEDEGRCEAV